MELSGTYTFDAPRELVWEMLLDPEVLARIMPGCDRLERVGENEYVGQLKIKVGPVQGVFQGNVHITEAQPPQSYRMTVNGKGPQGIVDGQGKVQLEANGAGVTLHYEGQAYVSGRIASVGQRLMDSSAKAIVKQSLQNLETQVQARLTADQAPPPTSRTEGEAPAVTSAPEPSPQREPPPPPNQTDFILGVARDIWEDLVPDPQTRQLVGALVGLAIFMLLRAVYRRWVDNLAGRIARRLQENQR